MPKAMIVDDDQTSASLLQTLLELEGFDVVLTAGGANAFQEAKEAAPDIFLVDYHLSDFDGVDFVKRLRADTQFGQVPVIMVSGLDHEDEAIACGANRFLIKPFDFGDLVVILKKLLDEAG